VSVGVLLAVQGPAEARLVAAWEARRRELVVTRRCADLAEALAAAAAGLGQVVVLGDGLPGADAETVAFLREHAVGLLVLVAAGAEGDAAERRWRQMGAATVARLDDPPEVLAALVDECAGAQAGLSAAEGARLPVPAAPALGSPGRVVAVWGAPGSTGRTTVAVNLAAELAATGAGVLLADLDTRGASVAQALGLLDEAPGLLAAVRAAGDGRLDAAALTSTAREAVPGVAVLSGSPDPRRAAELRPVGLRRVLEVAAVCADWVVLDLAGGLDVEDGTGRDAASLAGLEAADLVLVVGASDPVGLQRFVRAWGHLQDAVPGAPALAVLTRVRSSAVGRDPGRRVRETVRRFAGVDDPVLLPEDVAVDGALLAGRTLAEHAPRTALRRGVQLLAQRVEAEAGERPDNGDPAPHPGFDPLLASS